MPTREFAVEVQDLAKRYRIGARPVAYRTLREQVARAVVSPFRRLRSALQTGSTIETGGEVWAVDGVSFSVRQGEVVAVVGRNGAGKTTLLKILSRITTPTRGLAVIHGRVASLLEVGTGFHPELTGRENIYLNGAILGMRREEIESKFDAIVSFAEVDRFIDTQVKHYSSGMYLRLAFAVAAHLEPEILLVDEVLAVGDASFQKKCLGKMNDVATSGRTVLFVSHNMEAVQRLCPRTLWLEAGRVVEDGPTDEVVAGYLAQWAERMETRYTGAESSEDRAVLRSAEVHSCGEGAPDGHLRFGEPFLVEAVWENRVPMPGAVYFLRLFDSRERLLFTSNTTHTPELGLERPGLHRVTCEVPSNVLVPGEYSLTLGCFVPPSDEVHTVHRSLGFAVTEVPYDGRLQHVNAAAVIAPPTVWRSLGHEPHGAEEPEP